jgi:putative two-component system response regulator
MKEAPFVMEISPVLGRAGQSRPSVLIAGEGSSLRELADSLIDGGFSIGRVVDGWAALDRLGCGSVDVLVVDRALAGLDGVELCRLLKRDPDTRLVPIVLLLAGAVSRDARLEAIEAGADQILSTPIEMTTFAATLRALARAKRATQDYEPVASVMTTVCAMLDARNRYVEGHCHRMANYAASLGRRIGMSGDQLHALRRGGFVHDIGMLTIPDDVLLKPGTLDANERALIESHPIVGESLIANLKSLRPVREIVRHHHERQDGSGYPDGLRGEEIPLSAQIVGLVDVFEALTSVRPYQGANTSEEALAVLERQVAIGWHRIDLFETFAAMVRGEAKRERTA